MNTWPSSWSADKQWIVETVNSFHRRVFHVFSSLNPCSRWRTSTYGVAKGPVPLHFRMQRGCKTEKKSCHTSENAVHPLCTHCIHVSYALSVEHPSIIIFFRAKGFELHKTFRTDELSAVYDVNPRHVRATNVQWPLNVLRFLSAASGHTRNSHPL